MTDGCGLFDHAISSPTTTRCAKRFSGPSKRRWRKTSRPPPETWMVCYDELAGEMKAAVVL
jgi:hypothetical protein